MKSLLERSPRQWTNFMLTDLICTLLQNLVPQSWNKVSSIAAKLLVSVLLWDCFPKYRRYMFPLNNSIYIFQLQWKPRPYSSISRFRMLHVHIPHPSHNTHTHLAMDSTQKSSNYIYVFNAVLYIWLNVSSAFYCHHHCVIVIAFGVDCVCMCL